MDELPFLSQELARQGQLAVVHAVEAVSTRHQRHSQSHRERRQHVRRMLPTLWVLYYRLDTFSRQARYEGFRPDPTLLKQLVDHDLPTLLSAFGVVP